MKQYKSFYHAMYKKYVAERLYCITHNTILYKIKCLQKTKRNSYSNLFSKRNKKC